MPFISLSPSNVTHFTVKGSGTSYQYSAENTCFGIIKLDSKEFQGKRGAGHFEYTEATVQKMSIQGMQPPTTQVL